MISRDLSIGRALRARQRGFLLNPFRFGGGGGGGPSFSDVSLLLHMDGENGSTAFPDSSSRPKTMTAFGNAQITTTAPKFGTGSGLFDGAGDYLSTPVSADFQFGSGDFTIEGFVNPATVSSGPYAIFYYGNGSNTDDATFVWIQSGAIGGFIQQGSTNKGVTQAISASVWSHFAFVRKGNLIRMYVEGVSTSSTDVTGTTIGLPSSSPVVNIGAIYASRIFFFNGKLDELRIVKGFGLYESDFTPPPAAFPNS